MVAQYAHTHISETEKFHDNAPPLLSHSMFWYFPLPFSSILLFFQWQPPFNKLLL